MGKGSKKAGKQLEEASHDQIFAEVVTRLASTEQSNEDLRESLADLIIARDNIGWVPMAGNQQSDSGPNHDTIKNWLDFNRQLGAINPLMKRAKNIRIGYIYGEGIEYLKPKPRVKQFIKRNKEFVFSSQAYEEFETALNTDGQVFDLLDRVKNRVIRVPIEEIAGMSVDPDNSERVLYIRRAWTVRVNGDSPGTVTEQARSVWYPVIDLDPNTDKVQTSIDGVKVDPTKTMLRTTVNKQSGWLYGIPDMQSTVFWARAYKEFLEDNYKLVKALARFTWKVTAQTPKGITQIASQVAGPSAIDPMTGRPTAPVGQAAAMGSGNDLQAINKAGATVNFEVGEPLAAMVAAGMEVPLNQLLAKPGTTSDQTLDPPTLKAMRTRQALAMNRLTDIFTFFFTEADVPEMVFPPIQAEAIHRTVQAIVTAATTNTLTEDEIRDAILLTLRDVGVKDRGVKPSKGQYADWIAATVNENPGTSPLNPAGGGDSGVGSKGKAAGKPKKSPAGALADGDHSQRKSEAAYKAITDALQELLNVHDVTD